MQTWKLYKTPLLLTVVSLLLYWIFAYDLVRTSYTKLIVLYTLLWIVFFALMKYSKTNLKFLTAISFVFRAVFILAIPNLSQDFYRFIWDGRMLLEGFNPYLFTPESFINSETYPINQAVALYQGMGSLNGSHFTNYPPINQFCFAIAALCSPNSILGAAITLRLMIIAADFGILVFGKRLLKQLNLPEKRIYWYLLNPFVIIELTGNLHFEGVMIFFLIWSLYLLHQGKWKLAALVFAVSISVKLIPLLFLPLFFTYFKDNSASNTVEKSTTQKTNDYIKSNSRIDYKRLIIFYSIIGVTTLLLFAPFFSLDFVNNYTETVALWFNNFEFNASVYYIARYFGYFFRGYNEIAIIGKILPILVFLFIMGLAILKKNHSTKVLIHHMLFAFAVYLFLSTTVHPWYLATLLILSVFTAFKFPLVWSFVIILSYLSYLNINKAEASENLWIIALEYSIVFGVLIWELLKTKKPVLKTGSYIT